MSSNFPVSTDSLSNPNSNQYVNEPSHSAQHTNANDAIEALQTKVGVDSSSVATCLDYLLKNTSSSNPGHKHTLANGATDLTATASEINTVCDGYSWAAPNSIGSTSPGTGAFTTLVLTGSATVIDVAASGNFTGIGHFVATSGSFTTLTASGYMRAGGGSFTTIDVSGGANITGLTVPGSFTTFDISTGANIAALNTTGSMSAVDIDVSGNLLGNFACFQGNSGTVYIDSSHILSLDGEDFTGAFRMDYITGSSAAASYTLIDQIVNTSNLAATSEIHGLDVATAAGAPSGKLYAIGTHPSVGVIHQHTGTPATPAANYQFRVVGGSYTGTIDANEIFVSDNDEILVGHTAAFDELEIIMTTPATKNVFPTFWYLDNSTAWIEFFPADDTDGFTGSGEVRWDSSNFTNWDSSGDPSASDTGTGYWMKVVRTRNADPGAPTPTTVKYVVGTEYEWDSSGHIDAASFQGGTATITGLTTLSGSASVVDVASTGNFTGIGHFVATSGSFTTLTASGAMRAAQGSFTTLDIATGANIAALNMTGSANAVDIAASGHFTAKDLEASECITFDSIYACGDISTTPYTIDWNNGNKQTLNLAGTNTLLNFTAPPGVANLVLKIYHATANTTISWNSSVIWAGGTAPTLSTGTAEIDIMSFFYDGSTYYAIDSLDFS